MKKDIIKKLDKLREQYDKAVIKAKDKELEKWDVFDIHSAAHFLIGDIFSDVKKLIGKYFK